MTTITAQLHQEQLITPPKFLLDSVYYETEVGSVAYGVSSKSSDMDIYGFSVPPKEVLFPHLRGEIPGFGRQKKRFDQFQQHGIQDTKREVVWDLTIYSIVRYFSLCMDNNPNMLESLFTPERCVVSTSPVAQIAREGRKAFLHKGAWHKFKGFAYSQVHKMKNKNPEGKRVALVEKYGYDVKFAYHAIRLMDEVEQILIEGDLTLDANTDKLLAIRRGEWTQDEVLAHFEEREHALATCYEESKLPHSPDEGAIRKILLACLEEAWGNLDGIFGT